MEALEVNAKTVEEAVDLALEKMGLARSEVKIEVLQEGKRGILGWGGEEARVRVVPLASLEGEKDTREVDGSVKETELAAEPAAIEDVAREVAEQLLSLLKVPATIEVKQAPDNETPIALEINGDDPGILIGRRGQTLSALQYMINFIASRKCKTGIRVIVDVAGYRKRRQDELENTALRVAELVKSKHRPITLEPMLAWERRAVHIALRDDVEVNTGSVGFGDRRKVVISPKKRN